MMQMLLELIKDSLKAWSCENGEVSWYVWDNFQ